MYEDAAKDLAWMAWREAWNKRTAGRTLSKISERTAQTQFERYWDRNT